MKVVFRSVFLSLILAIAFFLNPIESAAQGCVMCKAQVGEHKDQDEAKLVGTSLNTGILYLMAAPYLLIGTIGFIWYRNSRKKAA